MLGSRTAGVLSNGVRCPRPLWLLYQHLLCQLLLPTPILCGCPTGLPPGPSFSLSDPYPSISPSAHMCPSLAPLMLCCGPMACTEHTHSQCTPQLSNARSLCQCCLHHQQKLCWRPLDGLPHCQNRQGKEEALFTS